MQESIPNYIFGAMVRVTPELDLGLRFSPFAPVVLRGQYQLYGDSESAAKAGNLSLSGVLSGGLLLATYDGAGLTFYSINAAVVGGWRFFAHHIVSVAPFFNFAGLSLGGAPASSGNGTGSVSSSGSSSGSSLTGTRFGASLGYQYDAEALIFRAELTYASGSVSLGSISADDSGFFPRSDGGAQALNLLQHSTQGLFCPDGPFHIDPSRGVDNAVITHAHSDHARIGSRRYFCAAPGEGLLRERLGKTAPITAFAYGERFRIGRAELSFHPAGHILGSAQVRIAARGRVWVVSGDYKRDEDPTCAPFEPVACDTFITEATFASPLYRWPPISQVAAEVESWWRGCAARGLNAVLYCYSLGKAQRLLAELRGRLRDGERVLVHPSIDALNRHYRDQGVALAATETIGPRTRPQGALVLAPPGAQVGAQLGRLGEHESGFASGWMRLRRARFTRRYDRGFVLSDHADWPSLLRTVRETGARDVYVMHGYNETLARYLTEREGLRARPIEALHEQAYEAPATPAEGALHAPL